MRTAEEIAADMQVIMTKHNHKGWIGKLLSFRVLMKDTAFDTLWLEAYNSKQLMKVYKLLT
jgi:hypothetical protein